MADSVGCGSESSHVFDYKMLFDDITSGILMKLESSRRCDVVDELVDEMDMAMLMDARLKVFRFAKKKLLEAVGEPGKLDLEPAFKGVIAGNSPSDAERVIEEWGMITRKGKPRVALDIIELLSYASGQDSYFPHKLLKKRQKKKTAKAVRKPAKQALIPFKPAQEVEVQSEEDTSDSEVSVDENEDGIVAKEQSHIGSQDMFVNTANVNECVREQKDDEERMSQKSVSNTEGCDIDQGEGDSSESDPDMDGELPDSEVTQGTNDVNTHSNGERAAHAEMYEIPEDVGDHTSTATARQDPAAESGYRVRRPCANLGRSETIVVNVPPVGTQCRKARPQRSVPVVIDVPPDPAFAQQPKPSPQAADSAQEDSTKPSNSPATIMATQTDWDLWGMPVVSAGSPTIRSSSSTCSCDTVLKKFNEWRLEVEKEMRERDSQYRYKLNYLREEKMKADGERERMRNNIASLTKKVMENSGHMAETLIRTQRDGIPAKPKQQGAVAYQGWDGIEEFPSDPVVNNSRPTGYASGSGQYPVGNSSQRQPTKGSSGQQPNGAVARQGVVNTSFIPGPVQAVNVSRAIVHRDPSNGTRNPGTSVQYKSDDRSGGKDSRTSSSIPPGSDINTRNGSNGKPGSTQADPLPQRPNQNRSRGTNFNPNSKASTSGRVQAAPSSSGASKSSTSQSVTFVSWADEPVSDVELITMAETTTPDGVPLNQTNTPASRRGNQSKSDILREAIVETQLKEMRNRRQFGDRRTDNQRADKGEKRQLDPSSGNESSAGERGSYAEVASMEEEDVWLTAGDKIKKKKKARAEESMLELLGVKDSPNKELFVLKLDYSRCRRPEQLEGMVRRYCRNRGVEVLFAKAYVTKSDNNQANCKVSVNEADVPALLSDNLWPRNAYARHWYTHPAQQIRNDKSSDDESQTD